MDEMALAAGHKTRLRWLDEVEMHDLGQSPRTILAIVSGHYVTGRRDASDDSLDTERRRQHGTIPAWSGR